MLGITLIPIVTLLDFSQEKLNQVTLTYHNVRGLYFQAVVFAGTIIVIRLQVTKIR